MQIHQDHNGVKTTVVEPGHVYNIGAGYTLCNLFFQNGPIKEVGVNGITNEALLAILQDRLAHLNGIFPCIENEEALGALMRASEALNRRTQNRINRGVEGKNLR